MGILEFLLVGIAVLAGLGSTLVILVTMFGTLGYKIFRKIKYGMSLYD